MTGDVATTREAVLVPRGRTLIAVLLDRSGSMMLCREDMQAAYAEFIVAQRAVPGRCSVSLHQFDHEWEPVYQDVPLAQVPPLVLEPRGSTALNDAIARTIATVHGTDAEQVIVVIVSDGEENASKEFRGPSGAAKIAQMIRRRQAEGWRFVFLGLDQDAFAAAAGYGIARTSTVSSSSSTARQAMSAVTDLVVRGRQEE
jgi:Mg-chelatase subunit ChlD